MRDILRRIGSFFEHHVEKLVLGIIGLLCLWLLFTRVIFSPNVVSCDKKNFGPSAVDTYVEQRARELQQAIGGPATSKYTYQARLDGPVGPNDPVRKGLPGDIKKGFVGLMDSPLGDIGKDVQLSLPMYLLAQAGSKREYRLPKVGQVTDVAAGHIRAVAYVPVQDVTEQSPYDKTPNEANDIDLVTVEAEFDVAGLYQRFYSNFAGEGVKEDAWRDPCLAQPVFAAVQLQKQSLVANGVWSDWQVAPRTRADHRKRLFEIREKVEDLPPGGIKVRMLQYNDRQVKMDLLQPTTYQIASANEDWFPPSLHGKYADLRKKEALEAKQAERQKDDQGRGADDRGDARRRSMQERGTGTGGTRGGAYEGAGRTSDLYGTQEGRRGRSRGGLEGGRTEQGRTGERTRGTVTGRGGRTGRDMEMDYLQPEGGVDVRQRQGSAGVYDELDLILINELTDMSKVKEPLVFWAHDDTAEPGGVYRYRIRLGVFNPVAGTNQVAKEDAQLRNQAILWSEFSDVTAAVNVPQVLYFFARDMQEADTKVTVEVSRYALGYWRSKDFPVAVGEQIGKVIESETVIRRGPGSVNRPPGPGPNPRYPRPDSQRPGGPMSPWDMGAPGSGVTEPASVDYRTGAVLLDLVEASDWRGRGDKNVRQRVAYYDALYTYDGATIEHMAVRYDNWPKELAAIYQDIKNMQRQPQEPLRAWNAKPRRRDTTLELYEGVEGGYQEPVPAGRGARPLY